MCTVATYGFSSCQMCKCIYFLYVNPRLYCVALGEIVLGNDLIMLLIIQVYFSHVIHNIRYDHSEM